MISDIHLHTEFSGDSNTPVHAQIEQAIRLGMEEICITDHHDYDVISEIDFTLDIPRYVEEITRVREEYKDRIHVNLGIELGLQCHLKEYLEQLAGLGEHLGYLDVDMQERTLGLYLEQLDISIEYLRTNQREKCRLYTSLGIMGGMFLVIVMY